MRLLPEAGFFTYEPDLPEGSGFPMFGTVHLSILLGALIAGFFYVLLYRKMSAKNQKKSDLVLGILLVLLMAARVLYVYLTGHMNPFEVPLHICSISGFVALIFAIKNFDLLGQYLAIIGLPGTFLALIFPNWVMYPPVSFISMEGFLFHILVAVFIFTGLSAGKIRPDIRKIWKIFLFFAVTAPFIFLFNSKFDTNFWFVRYPSPGSPLEWILKVTGEKYYLLGYAVVVIVFMLFMYLIYSVFGSSGKKRRKK